MRIASWLVLASCSGGGAADDGIADADADTDTATDADTDADIDTDTGDTNLVPGEIVGAACDRDPMHSLLVRCEVSAIGAADAELVLSTPGQPDRVFAATVDASDGALLGWGLKPDTAYTWTIGSHSGTVHTDVLPEVLRMASIQTTGDPFGFDAVLQPLDCDGQVFHTLIDGDGDIVWYLPIDLFKSQLDGYEWSQADRSVLTVGRATFVEQHVGGTETMRLQRGVDFTGDLHHDAARWGEFTYLLHETHGPGLDVDGVHVFDGSGALVGTFHLDDHYDTSVGGGFFGDWAHSNGVNVTAGGEVVMSLLNFDTVLGIDGDPASPTFLDLTWSAVGGPDGLPNPVYSWVPGPTEGFDGQHNASLLGDSLYLFDNGSQDDSRALRMELDSAAGTVTVAEAWSVGSYCPVQGGAVPIDGGVLATCPESRDVLAFRDGATTPEFTLHAECDSGFFAVGINRGIPVTIE